MGDPTLCLILRIIRQIRAQSFGDFRLGSGIFASDILENLTQE